MRHFVWSVEFYYKWCRITHIPGVHIVCANASLVLVFLNTNTITKLFNITRVINHIYSHESFKHFCYRIYSSSLELIHIQMRSNFSRCYQSHAILLFHAIFLFKWIKMEIFNLIRQLNVTIQSICHLLPVFIAYNLSTRWFLDWIQQGNE